MPLYDLKCPNCGKIDEYFLFHYSDKKRCPKCYDEVLEVVFSTCKLVVLNRSKPGSFKFDVKKNDADNDMIHHFKRQEEQGGPKSTEEKKDVDYWHSVLKDKL